MRTEYALTQFRVILITPSLGFMYKNIHYFLAYFLSKYVLKKIFEINLWLPLTKAAMISDRVFWFCSSQFSAHFVTVYCRHRLVNSQLYR